MSRSGERRHLSSIPLSLSSMSSCRERMVQGFKAVSPYMHSTRQATLPLCLVHRSLLDQSLTRHFMTLEQHGKVCVEYVWIGGTGSDLRSKGRTVDSVPKSPDHSHDY
mmetsp:Transcript_13311/g.23416  ORF Transcript_13311/g.23416 Transcript_13311/m.23416 type:complete len:108 (-) Transcript_13311:315-638(-)